MTANVSGSEVFDTRRIPSDCCGHHAHRCVPGVERQAARGTMLASTVLVEPAGHRGKLLHNRVLALAVLGIGPTDCGHEDKLSRMIPSK